MTCMTSLSKVCDLPLGSTLLKLLIVIRVALILCKFGSKDEGKRGMHGRGRGEGSGEAGVVDQGALISSKVHETVTVSALKEGRFVYSRMTLVVGA